MTDRSKNVPTAKEVKEKALEFGASVCGIGRISCFEGDDPRRNPLSVLPHAKCIIGFGFSVPKGLYYTMQNRSQYYNYTNLGVKFIDETQAEIFLMRMGSYIEDAGYDACLQRSVPGMKIKGDQSGNPEVNSVYELRFTSAVSPEKPEPEVIIDYNKAGVVCGLGSIGRHGKLIAPKYGTFLRFVYIITDMPLECDEPLRENLCDNCGACMNACPGHAITENGVDSWQCSVYYRGAHRSNPFMTKDFLKDHPEREAILSGEKHCSAAEAKELLPSLRFLPQTHFGYVACLCGKPCELACYRHLRKEGRL